MSNQWLTALLLLSSMLESTASVGSELVSPSSASGFTSRFDLEGGVTNGREAALLTFLFHGGRAARQYRLKFPESGQYRNPRKV
jgi:hypothetical protein